MSRISAPKREVRWRVLVLTRLSDTFSIHDVREFRDGMNAHKAQEELSKKHPGCQIVLQVGTIEWYAPHSAMGEAAMNDILTHQYPWVPGLIDLEIYIRDERDRVDDA